MVVFSHMNLFVVKLETFLKNKGVNCNLNFFEGEEYL